jgi:Putative zincin peptidase
MLFRLGAPPNSLSDAELDSGEWNRLRQPPLWIMHLLAVPVGLVLAFVVLVAWIVLTPRFELSFAPPYQIVAAFLVVMLAGMCLQLLAHPGMGLKSNSVVGVWPSRLAPYTAYSAKLTKRRHIASLLLPLIVLAFMPPVIASTMGLNRGWLVFGSCLSAAIFGLNGFFAMWAAYQVPKGSIIAGRGFEAYWSGSLRPNHSIERTSPGKPDAASHLKR